MGFVHESSTARSRQWPWPAVAAWPYRTAGAGALALHRSHRRAPAAERIVDGVLERNGAPYARYPRPPNRMCCRAFFSRHLLALQKQNPRGIKPIATEMPVVHGLLGFIIEISAVLVEIGII